LRIYIFICIFLFTGCTNAYHTHFFREHPEYQSEKILSSEETYQSTGYIDALPNTTTHADLVRALNQAKKRIWIEIYTWTDAAKLTEPIINAHKRWVDVRVALEGNVFWTPKINVPVFRKLSDAGISVVYTDNHRYTFTHAKFWIIDDSYAISTGNWTSSFFNKNREYIYHNSDSITLAFLEKIFIADSTHMGYRDIDSVPSHIVISPLDARLKIEKLLLSTQKELLIYIQTLSDDHIISLLEKINNENKKITICTADNESNNARKIEFPGLSWKTIKKPYLHAKVIIVDHSRVFIGSHNFTTNAIENNREMGILLADNPNIVTQIESNFIQDNCI
jgi:cardiolipin synthase